MKQYQVPQFISIEDRVVGPLTLKQFFYLLGGVAAVTISYFLFKFFLFIIVAAPIVILTLLLAFFTYNGQPFARILSSAINFYLHPKLFIWKNLPHETKKIPQAKTRPLVAEPQTTTIPNPKGSGLSDLAWSLDIKEKAKR